MQADDGAQWLRFRTICCREWGIPPWEFDVAWNLGKIDIGQVHSSVDLAILTAPDPEIIEEYIYPGSIQARAESMQEEQLAQSWAGLVAMKERNIER